MLLCRIVLVLLQHRLRCPRSPAPHRALQTYSGQILSLQRGALGLYRLGLRLLLQRTMPTHKTANREFVSQEMHDRDYATRVNT